MKGQIAGIEDSLDKIEVDLDLSQEGTIFENSRRYNRQNSRGEYRNDNYRSSGYKRGRDRSRETSFSGKYSGNRNRSTSDSRLRSGSRASTNKDRIRCFNCREYDHFARDCPPLEKKKGYGSIATNAKFGRRGTN